MRFVRDDVDEELGAKFIILAGHDSEEDGTLACGAFIYIKENKIVIVVTYVHG